MTETLGELVRLHREVKGMSQRELAEIIEVNETTIWRVENDRVTPTTDTLVAIADALEVGISKLLPTPGGEK